MHDRYCFIVDWFDNHAELTRKYQLYFCPEDSSVEMKDVKQNRVFLKRIKIDNVKLDDLYIGAAVNVFARQLVVTDYADEFTRNKLAANSEKLLLVIDASALENLGLFLTELYKNKFIINKMRMLDSNILGPNNAGNAVAIEINKNNAFQAIKSLTENPDSIIGKHISHGSIHTSANPTSADKELESLMSPEAIKNIPRTAHFKNSTLAIIKPHAINTGVAGSIIDAIIKHGFKITDLEIFCLEKVNAEEFLEVYKDVLPEYQQMVDQLASGRLIAMEISSESPNIVKEFREFCGPIDPELAKVLRPKSLRGQFGVDKVRNSIHCTDLPDDAALEVEYFFKILCE